MNPSNVKQGAELKKERVGKDEWVGRPSKKLSSIQSGSCCLLGRAAEEEVKEQQHCAPCNVQCAGTRGKPAQSWEDANHYMIVWHHSLFFGPNTWVFKAWQGGN